MGFIEYITFTGVRELLPFTEPTENKHLFQGLLESKKNLERVNFPQQLPPKCNLKHSWNIFFYQFYQNPAGEKLQTCKERENMPIEVITNQIILWVGWFWIHLVLPNKDQTQMTIHYQFGQIVSLTYAEQMHLLFLPSDILIWSHADTWQHLSKCIPMGSRSSCRSYVLGGLLVQITVSFWLWEYRNIITDYGCLLTSERLCWKPIKYREKHEGSPAPSYSSDRFCT